VKKDLLIRDEMRKLFDISCTQSCRLKTLTEIFTLLKCFDIKENEIEMDRSRRAKLDINDMFMPVRGRRTKPSPEIIAEKKAKLEMLKNELFVPNRGRRDYRKKLPHFQVLQPMLIKRNNGIDLNSKDYFMPNRGRRQPAIDAIISEKFFPQRGKKSSSSSASTSAKVSKKTDFFVFLGPLAYSKY
jgi:hypothetical protein